MKLILIFFMPQMGEVSSSSPVCSAQLCYALFPDLMVVLLWLRSQGLHLLDGAVLCSDTDNDPKKKELTELETYPSLLNFPTRRSRMMLTYWRFIKVKVRTDN